MQYASGTAVYKFTGCNFMSRSHQVRGWRNDSCHVHVRYAGACHVSCQNTVRSKEPSCPMVNTTFLPVEENDMPVIPNGQ